MREKRTKSPAPPPALPTPRHVRQVADVAHALIAAEGMAYGLACTPEAQISGLSHLLTDHARRNNAFAEKILRHLAERGASQEQIDEAMRGVRSAVQLEEEPDPTRSIERRPRTREHPPGETG